MTLPFSGTAVAPFAGRTCVTAGRETNPTVIETGLLEIPFTVTTTFPVVAPSGTGTTMLVGLQLAGVPPVPLNITVLAPCVAPKLAPVIVTEAPMVADVADKFVMLGV
ncbi:MAG: hypothetical protein WAN60_02240 [Candidatus Sulfotelmatobacter sp.]